MSRCTRAVIYKENFKYNLEQIKKNLKSDTKICVAVKADAYGHNAVLCAKMAEEAGAEYLAIATVDEGIELRNAGIKADLLLLSLAVPEEFFDILENKITPLVFDEEYISLFGKSCSEYFAQKKSAQKADVFLAIDTGMGRVGCYPQEAGKQAKLISKYDTLNLKGLITHFCVSDSLNAENQDFTKEQYNLFLQAAENVKAEGVTPEILSCGASAALLNNTEMHANMVRPGIIAYGYYPDEITREYLHSINKDFDLKPVLALETKVVSIKHFTKGQSISYGRTYVCQEDTDVAVLPIGYADGLLRRFSPGLTVSINGNIYPVRGRICMDQCMVELGKNHNVKLFDTAMIFGPKESGAHQDAEALAKIGNTISYEVLTSLSKRVKRFVK